MSRRPAILDADHSRSIDIHSDNSQPQKQGCENTTPDLELSPSRHGSDITFPFRTRDSRADPTHGRLGIMLKASLWRCDSWPRRSGWSLVVGYCRLHRSRIKFGRLVGSDQAPRAGPDSREVGRAGGTEHLGNEALQGGFPGCWTLDVEPLPANAGTENDAEKKIKYVPQPTLGDRASTVLLTVLPARRGREGSDRGGCASDGQAGHLGSSFGGQLSSTGVAHRCLGCVSGKGKQRQIGGHSALQCLEIVCGAPLCHPSTRPSVSRWRPRRAGRAGMVRQAQMVFQIANARGVWLVLTGEPTPGLANLELTAAAPAGQGVRFLHVQI